MRFVFVDGYNVVNSWDILKKEKSVSLESARQKLIDILDNYGAINGCKVILVFDGYKVAGNRESKYEYNKNLMVIFTKDGVTADAYIDPSVMNYAIQAVAGVVIAVGAAAGIYWRKAKKKIDKSLGIDENRNKEVESDDIMLDQAEDKQEK